MRQKFFQSHECGGYKATVTIEWSTPDRGYNGEHVARAEDIADDLIGEYGPKMRDMVQIMRGRR